MRALTKDLEPPTVLRRRRTKWRTTAAAPPARSRSCLGRLAAHLFDHHSVGQCSPFELEQCLRIDAPEDVQEQSHQPGPACLMGRSEPRAVVAVEVLVEQ